MDADVYLYVQNQLPQALRPVVADCFQLFEELDYKDYEPPYIEMIVAEHYMHAEDLQDLFMQTLHKQLNEILDHFHIQLKTGTPVALKAQFVSALHEMTSLVNYEEIFSVLQTTEPEELKLAKIISTMTGVDEVRLLDAIEWFDQITLERLSAYILKQHEFVPAVNYPEGFDAPFVIRQFKKFNQVCPPQKTIEDGEEETIDYIGIQLAKSTAMGEPFALYFSYVHDAFDDLPPPLLARQFLSLSFLAIDTHKNPLQAWRDNNHLITSDYQVLAAVEKHLLDICGQMEQLPKDHHEKA